MSPIPTSGGCWATHLLWAGWREKELIGPSAQLVNGLHLLLRFESREWWATECAQQGSKSQSIRCVLAEISRLIRIVLARDGKVQPIFIFYLKTNIGVGPVDISADIRLIWANIGRYLYFSILKKKQPFLFF